MNRIPLGGLGLPSEPDSSSGDSSSDVDDAGFFPDHYFSERIPGPARYSFHFGQFHDEPLGCTLLFGKACMDGALAGKLLATLMIRKQGANVFKKCALADKMFLRIAAEVMDEQEKCSPLMREALQNDKQRMEAVDKGNLLIVDKVQLLHSHRGQDLGLSLLLALFKYCGSRWELAVTAPAPLEDNSTMNLRQAELAVCAHFARVGFEQVGFGTFAWFLERRRVPSKPFGKNYFWRAVPPQELSHLCWVINEKHIPNQIAERILVYLPKASTFMEDPILVGIEKQVEQAIEAGNLRRVEKLGAGVCLNKMRACHLAVEWRQPRALGKLLDMKAEVSFKDPNGATPLHAAAEQFDVKAIRILLNAKANVAACDTGGRTPVETCQRSFTDDVIMRKAEAWDAVLLDGPEVYKTCSKLLENATRRSLKSESMRPKKIAKKPAASALVQEVETKRPRPTTKEPAASAPAKTRKQHRPAA